VHAQQGETPATRTTKRTNNLQGGAGRSPGGSDGQKKRHTRTDVHMAYCPDHQRKAAGALQPLPPAQERWGPMALTPPAQG